MELVGYRVAGYDTPLWVNPNRRPGRFHADGDPPTQYLCLHPLGPWAETLRAEGRRRPGEVAALQTRVWALRVSLADAALVTVGFGEAAAHGLTPAALVAEDWGPCQDLARRLRGAGAAALRVPSAALPGTENLVLFGPRLAIGYALDPLDPEDVPAGVVAERAHALATLPAHVRYAGQSHPGPGAHRAGHDLRFDDPLPALP